MTTRATATTRTAVPAVLRVPLDLRRDGPWARLRKVGHHRVVRWGRLRKVALNRVGRWDRRRKAVRPVPLRKVAPRRAVRQVRPRRVARPVPLRRVGRPGQATSPLDALRQPPRLQERPPVRGRIPAPGHRPDLRPPRRPPVDPVAAAAVDNHRPAGRQARRSRGGGQCAARSTPWWRSD